MHRSMPVLLVLCLSAAAQTNLPDGQHHMDFKRPVTLETSGQYIVQLPTGYAESGNDLWPAILIFHGSGESGTDLERVKGNWTPMMHRPDFPFIVIAPQASKEEWLPMSAHKLLAITDDVLEKYRIDPDRFYMTGLSMGGMATWQLACWRPETFAAIAPVCGRGSPSKAAALKDMPIWAFHGAEDPVVSLTEHQAMVDAVQAAGGTPRFTIFPGIGHDSWVPAYRDPALYLWFLDHARPGAKPGGAAYSNAVSFCRRWQSVYDFAFASPNTVNATGDVFDVVYARTNASDSTITESIRWILQPGCGWKVKPVQSLRDFAPGETGEQTFTITFSGPEIYPLPERKTQLAVDGRQMVTDRQRLPLPDAFIADHPVRFTCVRLTTKPTLDGKLDDATWTNTHIDPVFRTLDGSGEATFPTEVRIGYDDHALYCSFRCRQPNLDSLKITHKERDGFLWEDDSVELFLDTRLNHKDYFHFIANADGFLFDEIIRSKDWNSSAKVVAGREADAWTIEMEIPWADMQIEPPSAGTRMGLELVRTKQSDPREQSQWSPTLGDNHTPSRFGVLEFR
jgi:predicted esterase